MKAITKKSLKVEGENENFNAKPKKEILENGYVFLQSYESSNLIEKELGVGEKLLVDLYYS